MSKLGDLARQRYEQSEAKRGVWTPRLDGRVHKWYVHGLHTMGKYTLPDSTTRCRYFEVAILGVLDLRFKKPVATLLWAAVCLAVATAIGYGLYRLGLELYRRPLYLLFGLWLAYVLWCRYVWAANIYTGPKSAWEEEEYVWWRRTSRSVRILADLSAPAAMLLVGLELARRYVHTHRWGSRSLRALYRALFKVHFGTKGWMTYIRGWLAVEALLIALTFEHTPLQEAAKIASWTIGGVAILSVVLWHGGRYVYAKWDEGRFARVQARYAEAVYRQPVGQTPSRRRAKAAAARRRHRHERIRLFWHDVGEVFYLLWSYPVGLKRGICPMIFFKKTPSE